ncbi:MAG: hypothetical protein E6Q85_02740 [Thiothrix sp.]|nr:MAG: hypothetical protein E6Q85_02740 [Thiothrix sp.]
MNIHNKIKYIENLDFGDLELRLCDVSMNTDVDPLLTKKFYEYCTDKYLKFLKLCVIYPDKKFSPDFYIDLIWHYHILDTKKYINDCDVIFGEYFHHTPNYSNGVKNKEPKIDDISYFYKKHFETEYNLSEEDYAELNK